MEKLFGNSIYPAKFTPEKGGNSPILNRKHIVSSPSRSMPDLDDDDSTVPLIKSTNRFNKFIEEIETVQNKIRHILKKDKGVIGKFEIEVDPIRQKREVNKIISKIGSLLSELKKKLSKNDRVTLEKEIKKIILNKNQQSNELEEDEKEVMKIENEILREENMVLMEKGEEVTNMFDTLKQTLLRDLQMCREYLTDLKINYGKELHRFSEMEKEMRERKEREKGERMEEEMVRVEGEMEEGRRELEVVQRVEIVEKKVERDLKEQILAISLEKAKEEKERLRRSCESKILEIEEGRKGEKSNYDFQKREFERKFGEMESQLKEEELRHENIVRSLKVFSEEEKIALVAEIEKEREFFLKNRKIWDEETEKERTEFLERERKWIKMMEDERSHFEQIMVEERRKTTEKIDYEKSTIENNHLEEMKRLVSRFELEKNILRDEIESNLKREKDGFEILKKNFIETSLSFEKSKEEFEKDAKIEREKWKTIESVVEETQKQKKEIEMKKEELKIEIENLKIEREKIEEEARILNLQKKSLGEEREVFEMMKKLNALKVNKEINPTTVTKLIVGHVGSPKGKTYKRTPIKKNENS